MTGPRPGETMVVRGVTLRRDPAREACFTIAHLRSETYHAADMSEASRREKLHAEVNQELQSLEIAAQCLVDFSEAPWELRLALARQCWDESRHARLFFDRLRDLGGRKGDYPILNHEWSVVSMLDSLPARLVLQNRTFEAGSMDLLQQGIAKWREVGDDRTAEIMEAVLVDEIQHVRFGNHWLKRMARENPRVLLDVSKAMDYLRRVASALAPQPGDVSVNGVELVAERSSVRVNRADRQMAEFTEAEIAEIARRDGA